MQRDFIYDTETFLDIFSACIVHEATNTRWIFEVSERVNQARELYDFFKWLGVNDARLIGYNNEYFDWPVCDFFMREFEATGTFTAEAGHRKGTQIITSDNRFDHAIWPDQRRVTQVDLFKIHHFDNFAKSTSLKALEIAMRSPNVIDLPYPPDQPTTSEQKDEIIRYMCHDVSETKRFTKYSRNRIDFRDELAKRYPDMGDVVNFNDTKIGKQYFIKSLEKVNPNACYERVNGRRQPRQTHRSRIRINDIISPKITFFHPEFQRVEAWLREQEIAQTKAVFSDLSADIEGFHFDFGTGGIHGSLNNVIVRADEDHDLIDVDVASYYPNLAISNRWYPDHLGEIFCDTYREVYELRKSYPKKTVENEMLKLALNGVYGDSNQAYSPFYDPQYTMSITINGQLYLCMLAENLLFAGSPDHRKTGIDIVQINTDGLTIRVHKSKREEFEWVCKQWENHTGLDLEFADYAAMYIRDVNNYIAEKTDGSLKRIGDYAHETAMENPATREVQWHKDPGMLVVKKAAQAAMVDGEDVETFIRNHKDPFDFMKRVKVPRSSRLEIGSTKTQNTSRFYLSTEGEHLTKVMPPLKGKTEERKIGVEAGWRVRLCNVASDFRWDDVNWLYYVTEAKKLVILNELRT